MVRSQGIILATGRFLGNGLQADHLGIREPLFNLPVFQPQVRGSGIAWNFSTPRVTLPTGPVLRSTDHFAR